APGSLTESSLFQGRNELSSRAGQTGGIYPFRPARGRYKGVHPPARSAAYFSLGVVSAGRLGKITVAALRMEERPHPALRATLSRQAGEGNGAGESPQGKNMGAFAPNRGSGLPRAFGPRNDGGLDASHFGPRNDEVGRGRKNGTSARNNTPNPQPFIVTRKEGEAFQPSSLRGA
ncbi:MAG: hypothetical protein LBO00_08200, partial [Zoogloeaceae bacterium]|nr:hypothetical protein [Zoogloeaceae bacterium]